MSAEKVIDEIRDSLNGRPGQPIVFGVCGTLADSSTRNRGCSAPGPSFLRCFLPCFTVAAYIVLGFALNETEDRTRRFSQVWLS